MVKQGATYVRSSGVRRGPPPKFHETRDNLPNCDRKGLDNADGTRAILTLRWLNRFNMGRRHRAALPFTWR